MKFNPDGVSSSDIYSINEEAMLHFRRLYSQSNEARAYLRARGVNRESFYRFKIGYAPGDMALVEIMASKTPIQKSEQEVVHQLKGDAIRGAANYDLERIKQMNAAGLINWHQNKTYEKFYNKFSDRMMFPIRNDEGLVIGFGGRVFKENPRKNDEPKYMNTPETIVFSKRNHLYGLYEGLQSLDDDSTHPKRFDRIHVFEGFMDVIQAHQNGLTNSVASLGTAVTPEQIGLLMKYTDTIVFVFDGDKAGERASSKALPVAAPFVTKGANISFAFLPEGEDPDSFIKNKGINAFKSVVKENSRSFIDGVILEGINHFTGPADGGAGLSTQRYLYSVNILKKMFTMDKDVDLERDRIHEALSVLNASHALEPEFIPAQLAGLFKDHLKGYHNECDYLPVGDIPAESRSKRINSTLSKVDFS